MNTIKFIIVLHYFPLYVQAAQVTDILPWSLHWRPLSRYLQPSSPVGQSDDDPVYITPLVYQVCSYRIILLYTVAYLTNISTLTNHPPPTRTPDIVAGGGVAPGYTAVTTK